MFEALTLLIWIGENLITSHAMFKLKKTKNLQAALFQRPFPRLFSY